MRRRVLRGKVRDENENKSSGEKNGIEIENEPLELSRISLIKAKSVFLHDS